MYSWEESIHEDDEIKVLLKTDKIHFDRIANFIQENCSYDVPEIVAMEATHVNAKYLIWLNATVSK